MSAVRSRSEIKKVMDELPTQRLESLEAMRIFLPIVSHRYY
jgi:hypothetical protein